jgi:hypothetical protein
MESVELLRLNSLGRKIRTADSPKIVGADRSCPTRLPIGLGSPRQAAQGADRVAKRLNSDRPVFGLQRPLVSLRQDRYPPPCGQAS